MKNSMVITILSTLLITGTLSAQVVSDGDHGPGNSRAESRGYADGYRDGYAEGFSSLDFSGSSNGFRLSFNKGYVCSSEPSFSEAPVLGYGTTKGLAEAKAINNCITETGRDRMFCDDIKCEPLSFNSEAPFIGVSVVDGQVGVRFSSGSKYVCFADASFGGGIFVGEAPTKTEAKVYAERLCMGQTGNSRMSCDVERCEPLAGASGSISSTGISIGGINLGSIFDDGLSKEQKIAKLEKEIKVLEEKINNSNISKRKKRRLRRKLSRKQEQLIDLKAS